MNYYFEKQSISKAEFERNVPADYLSQLDEHGYFSWGAYWCQKRD